VALERPIRIIHCLEQVRSGGVERRRLSLARLLDAERFVQAVICTEAELSLRRQFEDAGCQVFEIGPMRRGVDLPKILRAANLMREFKPDIVHGAVFEGVILASLAGRLACVPNIIAEETITPVGRRWTGHLYYRFLASLAHEVVAISQGVYDYLTGAIRLPDSKVRLIYNGIAEPKAASPAELNAVRDHYGLEPAMPVLGTVSRLAASRGHGPDAHKRVSDAIEAMAIVLVSRPDARLLIVGDGPARPCLEQLARAKRIEDRVIFAGFQATTRPFFELIDVLLLPSQSEGLPLAPIEAMLASTPVIATDVAGSNEVVVDGETGFLVPLGQPQELARRSLQLLGDKALRHRMGKAGLERARALFTEERYVSEVAAMYQEAVGRRGTSDR
jgi:glycosyltransferase involved in cell wall biosynthesis